jgi:hypothetical protein
LEGKAKEQKNSNKFPNVRYENVSATTDKQKADLFASILKQTFSQSYQENDFDSEHKAKEEKKSKKKTLMNMVDLPCSK